MNKKGKTTIVFTLIIALLTVSLTVSGNINREYTLSNPNADKTATAVYGYLTSLYGKQVLSAQQESTWMGSDNYEFDYIQSASSKLPAIRGFDYMNDDFEGVNKRALEWWQSGGLVTICWHTGSNFSGEWNDAQNTEIADWDKALTEGTDEYNALISGMDKGAAALSELQKQGVTVLWRPFHEFDGKWFWWGKGGEENFKKLWRIMYERYTNYWKLNNLIWVLGYSHNGIDCKSWYVGNKYCDIIGADSYDGGAQPGLFTRLIKINSDNKPKCFHECGKNPDENELNSTRWLWFMTWHTEYLTDNNDTTSLNKLYNSELVITLDELPSFKE